jgi:hypothetical protein
MTRTYFYSSGGPAPLAAVATLADLNWMDPPLGSDGALIGVAQSDCDVIRAALHAIPGVYVLPALTRTLPAAALAVCAKYPAFASCKTTSDILALVYAQNPHPLYDPDA